MELGVDLGQCQLKQAPNKHLNITFLLDWPGRERLSLKMTS
jgi:hypothetical protein